MINDYFWIFLPHVIPDDSKLYRYFVPSQWNLLLQNNTYPYTTNTLGERPVSPSPFYPHYLALKLAHTVF